MRSLRDSAIIARAGCGVPHRQVAEEFGVSARTVSAVIERARKAPSPLDRSAMELVEELIGFHARLITDLLALADAYKSTNGPVALGALKGAGLAAERYTALLEETGKLPDLELVRAESELMRVGDLILEKLRDLAAGELTAAELETFVQDAIMRRDLRTREDLP